MSRNPESLWSDKVRLAMEKRGARVMRCGSASVAGTEDLVACFKGKYIAVEVKTATGRREKKQEHEARKVRMAGGIFVFVHDKDDLALLMKIFDEIESVQSTTPF